VTTVGDKPARYLIEMAAVIAGGTAKLRERPILSFMQCAVDPLAHDGPNLEANLVAAEHGLASGFMPMPLAAGTGPATLAGNLVVQNAEALSGVVLLELAYPGVPAFFAGAPSVIDLKTGGYTGGSPEDYLLAGASTQLAHFYGVPMAMGTMATGAKEPDWQAAIDDSLSTFASVMTSADMMNGCGLLNGSKILSYPHMVMESEIYGIVQQVADGIVVDDETLALDVIKKVGPNGNYLAEKHTRRHMKEIWRPTVWDRTPYDTWLREGKKGALEKATEIADDILANYQPEALPEDAVKELRAIVARADKEMAGA
jgi:trimethylamine--corrinoid protein Co-methyltransferase